MAVGFTVTLDSPVSQQFVRLLDASASALLPESVGKLGLPDDELHRDILIPLLPAMVADLAIRKHWQERTTGFVVRLKAGDSMLRWEAADFEIHVAASYLAAPDARALADTLLSEESLREMAAAIMNRVLETVWERIIILPTEATVPSSEFTLEVLIPRRFLSKNRRYLNRSLRYLRGSF